METIKVLFIEDDRVDQIAFERLVKAENLPYDYRIATSVAEAKAILDAETFDVIILDYLLGDGTAFELFNLVQNAPIIVVTGRGDEKIAVQAMKAGVYDYLIKDTKGNDLKALPGVIEGAIQESRAEQAWQQAREKLEARVEKLTTELSKVKEFLIQEVAEYERIEGILREHRGRLDTVRTELEQIGEIFLEFN